MPMSIPGTMEPEGLPALPERTDRGTLRAIIEASGLAKDWPHVDLVLVLGVGRDHLDAVTGAEALLRGIDPRFKTSLEYVAMRTNGSPE